MRRIKILKIFFVFMLFIVFLIYSNFSMITTFFMATLTFNIPITTIFLIGLLVIYQSAIRLTMLVGTFGTLAYKKGKDLEFYLSGMTKLMPPTIAHMFNRRAKKGIIFFTSDEAKDVIEWLENLFFQQKTYTSFFVGTALLLGLFGTFAGLLVAIDSMGSIILSFGGDNIDIAEIMTGFAGPLGGMAIGFASSLFGVATAIILNVMQYILSRSQAAFVEDVEDWMKGKIIEAQSVDILEKNEVLTDLSTLKQNSNSSNFSKSSGFLDVLVDTMTDFNEKMERSNNLTESMFERLTERIESNLNKSDDETVLLKNILETIKESNVNQFSNAKIMEESLQEIASVILAEHKSLKKTIELQEENNKLLLNLLDTLKKD